MNGANSLGRLSLGKRVRLWVTRCVERLFFRRAIDDLTRVLGGHIFFVTLAAAARLDLFTLLKREGPLTEAQLAVRLGLQPQPTRILLLGCVALGLIELKAGQYRVKGLARRLLDHDEPRNILPIIDWQYEINYQALQAFPEALKANKNTGLDVFPGTEPTLYQRLAHQPALEQVFQRAMQSISVQANHLLADYLDFSSVRYLIDVGGGNGTNIMALARKNPALKAAVFDSATVCEIARQHIAQAGLADRLGAVAGDCFQDPFPAGADAILFCHFFTIWSPERNQALLAKAYQALAPGGVVLIFNMMQNDDRSGPLTAAMGSPYFLTLATGEGMLYTWSEYEQWIRAAGFQHVVRRELIRHHGVVMGIK